VAVQINQLMAR